MTYGIAYVYLSPVVDYVNIVPVVSTVDTRCLSYRLWRLVGRSFSVRFLIYLSIFQTLVVSISAKTLSPQNAKNFCI